MPPLRHTCRGGGVVPLLSVLLFPPQALQQSPAPLDSVSRYVEAERTRQRIPGLSIAILRGDSVVLARGFGDANVELHVPASDSTIYQSGSVGKQFTATAVVMLAEQGKLSLDDPITRFLPEGPPAWRTITIRHLLTHTSGIPDYADSTMDWRRDYSEDELVPLVARRPLLFVPGERWSYSNTGYLLLGIITHRASGVFYGDFLRDHVFQPLGMRTTRIISEADIVPNRAAGYQLVHDTLKNQDWVSPSLNTTADGALYFTVRDLAQWAIALNHERVPSAAGLELSWSPVRLNNGGTFPYGFGWEVTQQRGYRRIGHSGSWQGFKAAIERYPDFNLTVIVLANLAQARQEAIAFGIAGVMEPRLTPAHVLPPRARSSESLEPLDRLLHAIIARDSPAPITPALRAFIGDDTREDLAQEIDGVRAWTPIGCDDVASRDIVQLGTRITKVCYSAGARPRSNLLMIGLYGADGRAANLDYYSF